MSWKHAESAYHNDNYSGRGVGEKHIEFVSYKTLGEEGSI